MKRVLAGLGVVAASAFMAVPAGAAATGKFSGSCTVGQSPYQADAAVGTITGVFTQPAHYTEIVVNSSNPAGNPNGGGVLNGNVTGPTANFGFLYNNSVTSTYSIDVWLVNDKTGNGHGDGSGDQFTKVATNLCSVTLP